MASFIIEGGHRLKGEIVPQGAKNEALQVLCAVLLTNEPVRIKNIPFLALLMPALFNGIIVGLEIAIFFTDTGFSFITFLITGGCVALGELVVLLVLGIPACILLNKQGKKMGVVLE